MRGTGTEGPTYKIVLVVLFILFAIGLVILVPMSFIDDMTNEQRQLREVGDWMVKGTFGTIIGVLTGKRLQ